MKRGIRILSFVVCLCIQVCLLCSCGTREVKDPGTSNEKTVYATFYPLYAAAQMLCDGVSDVSLHCLVQPQDGCLRDYQLSDWDAALLSTADLVIAGGRGLESFESVLYSFGEDGPVVSSILYNMDLVTRRGVNTQTDADSHWLEPNPHIYMTIDGMDDILNCISAALTLVDPDNESIYIENLNRAENKLSEFKQELSAELSDVKGKKVIVMNEALVYAAEDFGLEIGLVYERESGEGLYGMELADCLNKLNASEGEVILIEKQAPQSLYDALKDAGYRIALMDVMSARRANEGSEGYFDAQRENVRSIINAFTAVSAPFDTTKSGELS